MKNIKSILMGISTLAILYVFMIMMFVMNEKENYNIVDNEVEKIKQHIKERI